MQRKKFIALCTPTLGSVSIEWANVYRHLQVPFNYGMVPFPVLDVQGGEIAETRNRCVELALGYDSTACEVTHIAWLDDDVLASVKAFRKLFEHGTPIASGVYFSKDEVSEPLIFPGRGCGTTPFVPDKVFETWGHGMGLALVHTGVYRRMAQEGNLRRDKYGRPAWYVTPPPEEEIDQDGILWMGGTEDLYFLDAAGKLGYRPVIDTSRLAFGWHFNRETQQGYPKRQWDQRMAGKPIVWETPDGPVVWGG